ncbi:hypothetical protein CHC07_03280 [Variovorax sp. B4]|nr:hypothetical protein CHC06_04233 [Variovorax sp. B2]PNG53465.1 hypothetical protein CHC07_03280 [Variovorax sp. B4]
MPPVTAIPPEPLMTPLKVSSALDSVSVRPPRTTDPPPARLVMVAPLVPLISKTPSSTRPRELEMLPSLPRDSLAPLAMVVVPA